VRKIKPRGLGLLGLLVFAMLVFVTVTFPVPHASADDTAVDTTLKPPELPENDVAPIMRDMGVVQKRAMVKDGKFLFSNYWSMDFSDGPYTMYGVNFDFGYAISDFWEVYLNTTPFYITEARSIVSTVQELTLANGQQATITASKAQWEFGAEALWLPFYGKDSLGSHKIIRSDTFVKFGVSEVSFDTGTGLRFQGGVGKTFFVHERGGIRVAVMDNYTQTVVNGVKAFKMFPELEIGYVLYLF
jgi:hypothetical protein